MGSGDETLDASGSRRSAPRPRRDPHPHLLGRDLSTQAHDDRADWPDWLLLDTVRYYLQRTGLPIRPVGFTVQYDIDRKQLVKFKRQGLTTKQIADTYYGHIAVPPSQTAAPLRHQYPVQRYPDAR
jgi:hypothetical protein